MAQDLLLTVEERDLEASLSLKEEMETEEIKPKQEKVIKEEEKAKGQYFFTQVYYIQFLLTYMRGYVPERTM